jgi:mannose/fructose/N-acetylgalactosamine-specific phosphotransferase system component IID
MTYNNPFLNALLAALLGVLLVLWYVWWWSDDRTVNKTLFIFVAVACAILGFNFGEPFIAILLKSLH